MSEIRKSAKERETLGRDTGIVGLAFIALSLFNHMVWLGGIGLVVAIIGGIMWGAGMARRD